MTKLRNIHEQKCFDLLNDFISSVNVEGNSSTMKEKKEHTLAALEQLSITAGKSAFIYKPIEDVAGSCGSLALACIS